MKLLVFAHTPPPHHGQSYMVQLMLEGLPASHSGVKCFHINARLSDSIEDIGSFRIGKLIRLLAYCLSAIWLRIRHNIRAFYYVPAPGKPNAIYRDWLVLTLCRPFFPKIIFHWHAVGLGHWVDHSASRWQAALARRLHGEATLSIVLAEFARRDAGTLKPGKIVVIPNGIPDPCPQFQTQIWPERQVRPKLVFKVLFLAHCTREKGLFRTIAGVIEAHRLLADAKDHRVIELHLAGEFFSALEEQEFRNLLLLHPASAPLIFHHGFVQAAEKNQLLTDCDLMCFPTSYQAEGLPVCLLEAMAYGLEIITTRWRAIPEILPADFAGFVESENLGQIADLLLRSLSSKPTLHLRQHFLRHFTVQRHIAALSAALIACVDHRGAGIFPAAPPH